MHFFKYCSQLLSIMVNVLQSLATYEESRRKLEAEERRLTEELTSQLKQNEDLRRRG
jgi:hypothetical protein